MRLLPSSLRRKASAAYVGWREECYAVRVTYDRWRHADRDVEQFTWAAYVAALDREERAARAYRECADRLAPGTFAPASSASDGSRRLLGSTPETET